MALEFGYRKDRGRVCVWFGAVTLDIQRSCVHQVPLINCVDRCSLVRSSVVCGCFKTVKIFLKCWSLWLWHKKWWTGQFTKIITKERIFYSYWWYLLMHIVLVVYGLSQYLLLLYLQVLNHCANQNCKSMFIYLVFIFVNSVIHHYNTFSLLACQMQQLGQWSVLYVKS